MKLYLVQHGEAKSEAEDPQRSLTERGIEEVRNVAGLARRMGLHPLKIYHSGKQRAKQTAEIFAGSLEKPSEATQGLNPNENVWIWADRISTEKEDLMIVGHLPFLEKLASLLITGDEGVRPVIFRNGAVVCLGQKEDRKWGVRWILSPEMAIPPSLLC
ncbi:MAG TPA: phosphohistidine phosphatase SixA [Thermodesulfobacteriota bacterium]|nr:phosphohistidine phosphatase SixA [Thermodesulfobacteriota bacterium]